jgi:hypothetical protein
MHSARRLLARQSRLLAAAVAQGASKNRSSAISACVSRASLQMAAPWRGG